MIICHHCNRHVRSDSEVCVFCKESLVDALPTRPGLAAPTRGTRAALLFGAAAVVVACGGQTEPSSSSSGGTSSSGSSGASSSGASGSTSSGGSSSGVALYGAPAPDAGVDASDGGGVAPPYGAPAYGGPGM